MIKKNYIIILSFFLSSCISCIQDFYGVHEKPTPIHISYLVDKKKIDSIKEYIDSADSVHYNSTSCYKAGIKVNDEDKIVCLSNNDCECYLLSFSTSEIIIHGIYSSRISNNTWLLFEEEITRSELDRIGSRFKNEIIDKNP